MIVGTILGPTRTNNYPLFQVRSHGAEPELLMGDEDLVDRSSEGLSGRPNNRVFCQWRSGLEFTIMILFLRRLDLFCGGSPTLISKSLILPSTRSQSEDRPFQWTWTRRKRWDLRCRQSKSIFLTSQFHRKKHCPLCYGTVCWLLGQTGMSLMSPNQRQLLWQCPGETGALCMLSTIISGLASLTGPVSERSTSKDWISRAV